MTLREKLIVLRDKWCFTKERWYGNCKKVIVYLILLAFLLCAFWGTLSGKEIVDYIEADGIEEIVIKKTLEDGNGIEDYCTFLFTIHLLNVAGVL